MDWQLVASYFIVKSTDIFCIDLLALVIYSVVFRFLQSLLNHFFSLSVLLRSFFFIPPLFSLFSSVGNISGYPGLFSATFLPKYLTGCVSHCCIVGGNHVVYVYVIIPQVDEWCIFPTYCCLECPATSGFLNFSSSNLSLD